MKKNENPIISLFLSVTVTEYLINGGVCERASVSNGILCALQALLAVAVK